MFLDTDLFNTKQFIMISTDDLAALAEIIIENYEEKKRQQMEKSHKEMMTADEVCSLLHVNRSTLWRWDKDEYLKNVKVGKKLMYKRDEVEKVLNGV